MRFFFSFLILILFQSCSFDNKSGIWQSKENLPKKASSQFKDFKKLSAIQDNFNKVVELKKEIVFNFPPKINNKKWEDIYYNQSNNYDNFTFNQSKDLIFKSKKISRNKLDDFLLYDDGNLIISDKKGNIIIFSIEQNEVVFKFNFYKKEYKKMPKNLNLIVKKSIIYVSDNIGFIYAFDYKKEKVLWAKDYQIPFRSNLKINNENLIAVDQNNNIYFFNINDGNTAKMIPTEDTKIKNNFRNNISLSEKLIFVLNTYGSLYAINNENNKMNWFLNLNESLDTDPGNLFDGNQIINNNNNVIVTSNKSTYIINSFTGLVVKKLNIISEIKPLIVNNYLFLISKNNLIICVDLIDGAIIYSYKLNQMMAEFLKIKEKNLSLKNIIFANNRILILLKNSYYIELNINGNITDVYKFPQKIYSDIIFVNNSILYLNNKNKVIILG